MHSPSLLTEVEKVYVIWTSAAKRTHNWIIPAMEHKFSRPISNMKAKLMYRKDKRLKNDRMTRYPPSLNCGIPSATKDKVVLQVKRSSGPQIHVAIVRINDQMY